MRAIALLHTVRPSLTHDRSISQSVRQAPARSVWLITRSISPSFSPSLSIDRCILTVSNSNDFSEYLNFPSTWVLIEVLSCIEWSHELLRLTALTSEWLTDELTTIRWAGGWLWLIDGWIEWYSIPFRSVLCCTNAVIGQARMLVERVSIRYFSFSSSSPQCSDRFFSNATFPIFFCLSLS